MTNVTQELSNQNKMKYDRFKSTVSCSICGNPCETRDVSKPAYCSQWCFLKRGIARRYMNSEKGKIDGQVRDRLMKDKTVRVGPFYNPKKPQ